MKNFTQFKKRMTNYVGSSEYLKKAIDLSSIITKRFKVMIIVVLTLMLVLIARLYYIQMMNTEDYQVKLENYSTRYQTVTTPRGEIKDRNGLVLVANKQRLNITYFPPLNVTDTKEWQLAYKFSNEFETDISNLTSRDLKDLYIATKQTSFAKFINSDGFSHLTHLQSDEEMAAYNNLITDDEMQKFYDGQLTNNEIYYLRLSRITTEMLNTLDLDLQKAWVIKQAMDMSTSGQTKIIKGNASIEETAYLIEHSESYPGFDIEIDWERNYPYNTSLKGVLGTVSNSKQGLPLEDLDYYLALGYSRNDKVGRSGIEKKYEELLNGTKAKYTLSYDNNIGVLQEVEQGSKGYDLELAIDMDLQIKLEEKVRHLFEKYKDDPLRAYMNRINVVVQDPSNGDVLSMVSMAKDENGNVYDDPVDTYTSAYEPGSIVKGATVYMGLNEGVITPGEKIMDAPIKLKGTPTKASWQNLGIIDDRGALARSSNIYMFNIAIRLSGGTYTYDGPLFVKEGTFSLFRNYFSAFGLGTLTGLDVTNETIGYMGTATNAGNILDYSIGQYDTYTTMMLSQYIATIANDGIKLKPRLVKKAYESGTNEVVYENEVTIQNTLENKVALKRVQEGFYDCVNASNGLCYGFNADTKMNIAGKTGTAQAYVFETKEDGTSERIQTPNNSVVAYAPFDNPKVSVACIIPKAWNGDKTQTNLCLQITNEVINYYLYDHPFNLE